MSAVAWKLSCNRIIEASAGTGKTYTITTLVCRLVAEDGVPMRQLLVTTFTNAAAAELRDRVRERLAAVARELAAPPGYVPKDELVRVWRLDAATIGVRAERVARALCDLDQAVINTIHGFCQRTLGELSFEADVDAGRALVEDGAALIDGALADAWAEEVAKLPPECLAILLAGMSADAARKIALAALGRTDLPIVPDVGGADPKSLVSAANQVLEEFEAELRAIDLVPMADRMVDRSVAGRVFRTLARHDSRGEPAARVAALQAALGELKADSAQKATLKAFAAHIPEHTDAVTRVLNGMERVERSRDSVRAHVRVRLAHAVRRWATVRKQREGCLTFDDMLQDMRAALDGPAAEGLVRAVQARYQVVLVDEFQDTDQVQAEIFLRLFGSGRGRVFFIGDPKQSIYEFRGADLGAYERALRDERFAGERSELDTSYRTDAPLLDAVHALVCDGGALGGALPDSPHVIPLIHLQSKYPKARMVSAAGSAASGMRVVCPPKGAPTVVLVAALFDRTAEAIRLELEEGLMVPDGETGKQRRLRPKDIAVLVRTNPQLVQMQAALRTRGIPSVFRPTHTVWQADEAEELERILHAVAQPAHLEKRRSAGATELAGLDCIQVASLGDPAAADGGRAAQSVSEWLLGLRATLAAHGPVPFVRALLDTPALQGVPPARLRVLGRHGGERSITNLQHIAELLGDDWRRGVRGAGELAEVVAAARGEGESSPVDALLQRVESDGSAVNLLTAHGAKGLEWPVVWVPFYATGKWDSDRNGGRPQRTTVDGRQVLAVAGSELEQAAAEHEHEARAEQARLMYVALTRARHRCNLVWAASYGTSNSVCPIGLLLHARGAGSAAPTQAAAHLRDSTLFHADLQAFAARAREKPLHGHVEVVDLPPATSARWKDGAGALKLLQARVLAEPLPEAARTTSFTGLTRGAHDSGGDARLRSDDAQGGETAAAGGVATMPLLSRQVLPAGPAYGDLVHRIMEEGLRSIDSEGFNACVHGACMAAGLRVDAPGLALGLRSIARQPLVAGTVRGVTTGTADLRALVSGVARVELEYLLPAGGRDALTIEALVRAFRSGGEIARRYADHAARLTAPALRGHLVGFIDLVCCYDGRWYVLDYKTNALGPAVEAFAAPLLDEAMLASHYVLQYHLYALAVHRWLHTRVPSYTYESHFGGALYLFVRGMGDGRPAGSGVFADRPSAELIGRLDEVLAGGAP